MSNDLLRMHDQNTKSDLIRIIFIIIYTTIFLRLKPDAEDQAIQS